MQRHQIEAILGRSTRETNALASVSVLRGSTVLVTGAGGSIGSAICRTVVKDQSIRLVALDANEYLLHELVMSVGSEEGNRLVPVLGSINDHSLVRKVISSHAPRTIFHAAAYKHVPLLEANIAEAVRNNVLGTWNLCQVASEAAERLVFISTDKAVDAVSVLGATKRLGELIVHHFGRGGRRSFTVVRSGNVFGSSGSVIPILIALLTKGGPITVTDRRATRFFVTVDEAVELALWAAELTQGDDVFVLDAGQPVPIIDIVERLVATLAPALPPAIVFTGLRPGERLHERLLGAEERHEPTNVPGLLRISTSTSRSGPDLPAHIGNLARAVEERDEAALRKLLLLPPADEL